MSVRPPPMTPADCDLRDFEFMPLHVAKLRDSDLAAEEEPEACWYALLLWAASWHQIPAASLPDNDAVLTRLIGLGRDMKTFLRHKAGALRDFTICEDGRLYHPFVAELARDSWARKLEQRWRTECGRIKKANQRNGTDLPAPTLQEYLAGLPATSRMPGGPVDVPEDVDPRPQGRDAVSPGTEGACPQGNGVQGTGTGTGTSISEAVASESPPPSAAPAVSQTKPSRSAAASAAELASFEAWWALFPRKVGKDAARKAFVTRLRQGLDLGQLTAATFAYATSRAGEDPQFTCHPTTYLNQGRWQDEPPALAGHAPVHRQARQGWSALEQSLAHLRADQEDTH